MTTTTLAEVPPAAIPTRAVRTRQVAELTDVGDHQFDEPFFHDSLAALSRMTAPRRVRVTFATLAALAAAEALPAPAAFIFHTSRCGSTLLANMLGTLPGVRAIKEPMAVNEFLLSGGARLDESARRTLRALLACFGRGSQSPPRVVIKFTSYAAVEAATFLDLFPDTPAVFLWRPAAEVIASSLAVPRGIVDWRDDPELRRRMFSDPGAAERAWETVPLYPGPSPAILYAEAWRATAVAALDLAARYGRRVRLLSYDQLKPEPVAVAADLAAAFGIPCGDNGSRAMALKSRTYSKDPTGRARFDPEQAHSRPALSRHDRAVTGEITNGPERALMSFATAGQPAGPGSTQGGHPRTRAIRE